MIESLTLLLLMQLFGEVLARGMGLTVPGPVIGLLLLSLLLAWRGIGSPLHGVAHGVLRNLGLLFVPAGVGVIQHVGVLQNNWLALGVALLVSTLTTLLVTAFVFRWAARRFGSDSSQDGAPE